jgi:hypothetical protein
VAIAFSIRWLGPGMMGHTCNPTSQEAERLRIQGQPGLHKETLYQKEKRKSVIEVWTLDWFVCI